MFLWEGLWESFELTICIDSKRELWREEEGNQAHAHDSSS